MSVCGWREGRRDIVAEPIDNKCLCVREGRRNMVAEPMDNKCLWVEGGEEGYSG